MPLSIAEGFVIIGLFTGVVASTGAFNQDIPHEYFIIGGMAVPLLFLYMILALRGRARNTILSWTSLEIVLPLLLPGLGFLGWGITTFFGKGQVKDEKAIKALGIISGIVWLVCGVLLAWLDSKDVQKSSRIWQKAQEKEAIAFDQETSTAPLQRLGNITSIPTESPQDFTQRIVTAKLASQGKLDDDVELI